MLETLQKLGDFGESLFTVFGIIAAGIWAYYHFLIRRERYPRAAITHSIFCTPLGDGRSILRVRAKLSNVGAVVIKLTYARTFIEQFAPVPEAVQTHLAAQEWPNNDDCELPWPSVDGMREWNIPANSGEIEPGESEVFNSDFIVPAGVEQVLIYSFVTNALKAKTKTDIGWNDNVVVSIRQEPNRVKDQGCEAERNPSTSSEGTQNSPIAGKGSEEEMNERPL
jgi:hypothetical protein